MMRTLEELKSKISIAKETLTRRQVEYESAIEQLRTLGMEEGEDVGSFVKRKREAVEIAEKESHKAIKQLEEEVARIERAIE